MFEGFITLGSSAAFFLQVVNSSGTPSTPDAAPAYGIYGPSSASPLLSGNFSGSDTDSQTGWRSTGSLSITLGNGFAAGERYYIRKTYAVSSTNYVTVSTFVVV